ncbi:MAG TPA: hypothetical protein VMT12_00590 [Syntrophales bacterium]|nr:hypothetical protein [Syntrophales bacterium]
MSCFEKSLNVRLRPSRPTFAREQIFEKEEEMDIYYVTVILAVAAFLFACVTTFLKVRK